MQNDDCELHQLDLVTTADLIEALGKRAPTMVLVMENAPDITGRLPANKQNARPTFAVWRNGTPMACRGLIAHVHRLFELEATRDIKNILELAAHDDD